jgi:hypothetical protein
MVWRVANSLLVLRDQINAAFPGRSTISDGFIGDANHQNSDSDHNPWYGPGIVTAGDFTHDPAHGFDIDKFTDQLAASRDRRIKYIIANGYILDSRACCNPWQWVRYYGSNPHTSHVLASRTPLVVYPPPSRAGCTRPLSLTCSTTARSASTSRSSGPVPCSASPAWSIPPVWSSAAR